MPRTAHDFVSTPVPDFHPPTGPALSMDKPITLELDLAPDAAPCLAHWWASRLARSTYGCWCRNWLAVQQGSPPGPSVRLIGQGLWLVHASTPICHVS